MLLVSLLSKLIRSAPRAFRKYYYYYLFAKENAKLTMNSTTFLALKPTQKPLTYKYLK